MEAIEVIEVVVVHVRVGPCRVMVAPRIRRKRPSSGQTSQVKKISNSGATATNFPWLLRTSAALYYILHHLLDLILLYIFRFN